MTVQELKEKLDLIDNECEILVIDNHYGVHGIENARIDICFEAAVDNDKSPFCIMIN